MSLFFFIIIFEKIVVSIEKITYSDYNLCDPSFIKGVELLRKGQNEQALYYFEVAYEKISYSDLYHNVYASFCGYARTLNGDRSGLVLCREVARYELHDADVFCNLAKIELFYKNRKRAVVVLLKGLNVDSSHPGVKSLCKKIGMRESSVFGFLPRNNVLNRVIGKLIRK